MIHGDIKPQNVLVFKDATGCITFKIADFGYSTFVAGEVGTVILPKSRPWNAPEHSFGEFKVPEAKKTDVYSFGMLCLWVLFGNRVSAVTIDDTLTEVVSFEGPFPPHKPTLIEQLKDEDKMCDFADKLMQMSGLSVEHKARLKEFFCLTISCNPKNRTSDIGKSVALLSFER